MEKNMRLGPTVDQVTEALIPIYEGYVYRKKLIAQLNEQLGTHNLMFQSEKNAFFIMDKIAVSGWYDPVDDIRMINIVHAPGLKKLFIPDLDNLSFLISQTIKHETLHQRQLKYRYDKRYKIGKKDYRHKYQHQESQYLADPEEIHAYAHDIALEIFYYYPERNPLHVIDHIDKTRKLSSYNYYRSTYRKQPWDQVKQSLLKQVKKWLPHVTL